TFWKGETEYVLSNFKEALISFKQFEGSSVATQTPEYENLNYNLGYAYCKLKEYDKASEYYQNYTEKEKTDKVRLNDAYLRLGDGNFVTGKYWVAMETYNKAIEMKGADADYASYQKAISYGFVDRIPRKIEDLEEIGRAHV